MTSKKMLKELEELVTVVSNHQAALLDKCLLEQITKIEGRVPSDSEIRKHGLMVIGETGMGFGYHYTWKDRPIVGVKGTRVFKL